MHPVTKTSKHQTTVKWKSLSPDFHEQFVYLTSSHDLPKQSLYITVWNKEKGRADEYIGESFGERRMEKLKSTKERKRERVLPSNTSFHAHWIFGMEPILNKFTSFYTEYEWFQDHNICLTDFFRTVPKQNTVTNNCQIERPNTLTFIAFWGKI